MTYKNRIFIVAGLACIALIGLGVYGYASRGVAVWVDMATAFILSCL